MTNTPTADDHLPYRIWQCTYCSQIYNEAAGDPDGGISAGTPWQDLPDDWCCPDCGQSRAAFEPVAQG